MRQQIDPEGWAAEQAAKAQAQAQAQAQGGPGPGPVGGAGAGAPPTNAIKKAEKRLEQIDELLCSVRVAKKEAAQGLYNYILVSTSYSETQSLDAGFLKNSIEKGAIDAVAEGLSSATEDQTEFKCFINAYLGRLGEYDQETLNMLLDKGVVKLSLEVVVSLKKCPPPDQLRCAFTIFNIAHQPEVKLLCMNLNVITSIFNLLKDGSGSPEISACCCKALNQILYGATETTVPSKKEVAKAVIDSGGLTEALAVCTAFSDNEDVIEQWFPLIDSCIEAAPNVDSVGTGNIPQFLTVIEKHRFVIQVTGASILARLAENDELARHIVEAGGTQLLIKILGTESNLSKYEQKSREACLKCLNRCALFPQGLDQMRQLHLPKVVDAAMRGYGPQFIIQIQGILLIKAMAKDEGLRQQLLDVNVCSLLNYSAAKHTVTRLQKVVKELKETYPGF
eukprot:TRINITY_DN852_c0_g1_i4.p1 TRINITY_DN852_c0_g1~~TRINITY_DN852_c0_g1_i4.p1  ORF type:complete len:450 (+),score=93.12 TRINITY_DN852_c0_g1_i4:559-1908(+)